MLKKMDEIKDQFDVFLFDMYGVLWDGKQIKKDFALAAEALLAEGKVVKVVSNSVDLAKDYEPRWAEKGLIKGKHFVETVTSGEVSADIFSQDQRELKYYLLGYSDKKIFEKSKFVETKNLDEADFVYAGMPIGFDDKGHWHLVFDIEAYEKDLQKCKKMGLSMICCNPDVIAFTHFYDQPVAVDGAFAKRYREIGGEVELLGKPYPEIFDYALRDYAGDDARVLMIGDTLETDILGANSYGIKSMFVRGGVSSYFMQEEGFDDLDKYIAEVGIIPSLIL